MTGTPEDSLPRTLTDLNGRFYDREKAKVYRASVTPHWVSGERFWYRNDLANGRREFILVDPAKAEKRPAFDAVKLAASLSKTLGKSVDPSRLPVERVADCGCHDNSMDKIWWNEQRMGWPVGPECAACSNVTLAPPAHGETAPDGWGGEYKCRSRLNDAGRERACKIG